MTQSSTSSVFLSLSQHSQGRLAGRVEDLSIPDFIEFLERTTRDFKQFLKVIDLINNQSLEPMLDELLEAFTLKIGQILQAERTTIFVVDEDRQELCSKIAQGNWGRQSRDSAANRSGDRWICGDDGERGEYSRRLCG